MTFIQDKQGIQTNRPRYGVEIVYTAVTYRFATGDQDVMINGHLFKAVTTQRGESAVSSILTQTQMQIQMFVGHAAVLKYIRQCLPPQQLVLVNIWELQLISGEVAKVWSGKLTSVKLEGPIATLLIPSLSGEIMDQRLPIISVSRLCGNVLYDTNCTIERSAYQVTTTLSTFDGYIINVASMDGHPNEWAQYGEILHVPSGERATIVHQTGTQLEVHLPILDMQDGDAIQVFAGCAHDIVTCGPAKFSNQVNFAGCPDLPTQNPFVYTGFGVITQS